MYYTGIGSRETPETLRSLINKIAVKLEEMGYILRSGGANGADTFFGEAIKRKEIFIPWSGFNNIEQGIIPPHTEYAEDLLKQIHPAYGKLSQGALKLHLRNINQVLGLHLNEPSKFLICWAEVDSKGIPKGGTRTAYMLAQKMGITCFNLNISDDFRRLNSWINNK